jgi:glyoxylase-like metal-dependent hydrolase (beta-lactamase superfamily II)
MRLTKNIFFYPERGMSDCNTYVIRDDISVIIDPGNDRYMRQLIEGMRQDGIAPRDIDLITNTHLHADHSRANQAFKNISGAKIAIHPIHKEYAHFNMKDLPIFLGPVLGRAIAPVDFVEDSLLGDTLNTGSMEFELLHTTGHSPDGMCFYCRQEKVLISGDLVFEQGTGRVGFPGGNVEEMKRSIERAAQLDIELLLPSHKGVIKGKEAIQKNFDFVRKYIFPLLRESYLLVESNGVKQIRSVKR